MPYNESTTRRPDGSKTVRKEHIDPDTGKCTKIEITEYPADKLDFSVMSYTKQPKTTIIIPEDDAQESGFHSTTMPVIGKTTIGKTQTKVVSKDDIQQQLTPTKQPIKTDMPVISSPPKQQQETSPIPNTTTNPQGPSTNDKASNATECCCTIQ